MRLILYGFWLFIPEIPEVLAEIIFGKESDENDNWDYILGDAV